MKAFSRFPISAFRWGRTGMGHQQSAIGHSRAGQAIVEMVVGLVAILVVFAGFLQLGRMAHEHTKIMMEARAEAGEFALAQTYALQAPAPQYLYTWGVGDDGRRDSRDDKPMFALTKDVRDDLLAHSKPDQLGGAVGENPVTRAYDDDALLDVFSLVHGREESEDIPLYPVVRHLLYDADSIRLESDVWLSWARSIE